MWKKKLQSYTIKFTDFYVVPDYQNVRKIHAFLTQKVKSEFVDFYGLKLYLVKMDEENYSGGISY